GPRGIGVVIGRQRGCNSRAVNKLAGDASILASNQIDSAKNLERSHGDVAQIPDGSGDQVETRRQRRCQRGAAVQNVMPPGALAGRAWGDGGRGRPHAPYSNGTTLPRHGRREKSSSFSFG